MPESRRCRRPSAFGLLTLVSIIGRLSFGYLGDYITKRYLFMVAYAFTGLGLLVLMNAKTMAWSTCSSFCSAWASGAPFP